MTIGERIKQRRKEIGLSVEELAEKLGKNRATVYRYESNEIENLPISIIASLAKALNTTPAYLMGWEDNTEQVEDGKRIENKIPETNVDDDLIVLMSRGGDKKVIKLTPEKKEKVKKAFELVFDDDEDIDF